MPRQVRTTPRKRPRQARSRETVSAILAATSRVLVKHGFDGLTTNAVAEAAGVSIGSLYQYFPNKEALVAGLIERHVETWNRALFTELHEGTRRMVAAVLAIRQRETVIRDPDLAAFLLVAAVEAIAQRAMVFQ